MRIRFRKLKHSSFRCKGSTDAATLQCSILQPIYLAQYSFLPYLVHLEAFKLAMHGFDGRVGPAFIWSIMTLMVASWKPEPTFPTGADQPTALPRSATPIDTTHHDPQRPKRPLIPHTFFGQICRWSNLVPTPRKMSTSMPPL